MSIQRTTIIFIILPLPSVSILTKADLSQWYVENLETHPVKIETSGAL